jgi:repressor LexA
VLAEEHIEDFCDISPEFFRPAADYLLRVKGDSMVNVGILDGDLLAVHRTTDVSNGQIVVARIEDEVTVKRLQRGRGKTLTLLPENDDYEPMEVDLSQQQFAIEGLCVGVIRRD